MFYNAQPFFLIFASSVRGRIFLICVQVLVHKATGRWIMRQGKYRKHLRFVNVPVPKYPVHSTAVQISQRTRVAESGSVLFTIHGLGSSISISFGSGSDSGSLGHTRPFHIVFDIFIIFNNTNLLEGECQKKSKLFEDVSCSFLSGN
jgi:hypothetical protein